MRFRFYSHGFLTLREIGVEHCLGTYQNRWCERSILEAATNEEAVAWCGEHLNGGYYGGSQSEDGTDVTLDIKELQDAVEVKAWIDCPVH